MDGPVQYKIRVLGELQAQWSAWFGGMAIETELEGTSVLRGVLADQAALYGVLARIRDLWAAAGWCGTGVRRQLAGSRVAARRHSLDDG